MVRLREEDRVGTAAFPVPCWSVLTARSLSATPSPRSVAATPVADTTVPVLATAAVPVPEVGAAVTTGAAVVLVSTVEETGSAGSVTDCTLPSVSMAATCQEAPVC